MTDRRFIAWVLGSAVALAALVALFNAFVDPYLGFGRPRSAGFNDLKPAVSTHEPLLKANLAARAVPRTVVLGSSRSGIGIRPDSDSWPAEAKPVHNLSVVGTDLGQQLRYLYLVAGRADQPARPDQVVVGLDFESFLFSTRGAVRRQNAPPDEQQARLAALTAGGGAARWQHLADGAVATLTLDALFSSVATVFASARRAGNDLSDAGATSEWQLATWERSDGAYSLFEQKLALSARQLGGGRFQLGPVLVAASLDPERVLMKDVTELLNWAQQHSVSVTLMLQPSHGSQLLLLEALGFWPGYERWKRAVMAEVSRAQGQGAKVSLWDFGGFEREFSEPVLPRQATGLQWFWDPVHYKSKLGDRMVATTQGTANAPHLSQEPLTPATLEARLAAVRAGKKAWSDANPQTVNDITRWLPARKLMGPS